MVTAGGELINRSFDAVLALCESLLFAVLTVAVISEEEDFN